MTKVIIDKPSGIYWDNEGKYQAQYDRAWKQLIPASGEAEDGLPEALRAISRIGYDYYNNGFCNLWRADEEYDSDGSYYDVYVMDSYYRDMVEYLAYEIPRDLHKNFKSSCWMPKGTATGAIVRTSLTASLTTLWKASSRMAFSKRNWLIEV